jgi:hypothetical protein
LLYVQGGENSAMISEVQVNLAPDLDACG